MSILVVSVSHKTTSIERLSRLAMDPPDAAKLADALVAGDHVDEAVVLSTCNRTELYVSVSRFHGGLDDVTAELWPPSPGSGVAELRDDVRGLLRRGRRRPHLRGGRRPGLDGGRGEPDPRPGAARAHRLPRPHGTVGSCSNSLFQQALRVGKRVQTETTHRLRRPVPGDRRVRPADRRGARPLAGRRVLVVGRRARWPASPARTAAAAGAQASPAPTGPRPRPSGWPRPSAARPCRWPSSTPRWPRTDVLSPAPAPGPR